MRQADYQKPTPYSALKVLVVDDEDHMRELVCRMLKVFDLHAEAVSDATAAMHCLEQKRYDLLITDFQMPDVDGYALATWLKRCANHTRIVIMTGRNYSELKEYMCDGIVDEWLFKPFTMNHLAVSLDRLFNARVRLK